MTSTPTHLPPESAPALPAPVVGPADRVDATGQQPGPGTTGQGPVLFPVPPNPAPRANTVLMRKEHREKIALFRYQIIRAAADPSLTTRQRGPLVRAL
ncbi:hypothetical protein QMG52_21510, partial [Paenarthrobacter sp. PH39-S1]|nr:hypothetical protein [Paenarthrobacter sp. PH39-S1]